MDSSHSSPDGRNEKPPGVTPAGFSARAEAVAVIQVPLNRLARKLHRFLALVADQRRSARRPMRVKGDATGDGEDQQDGQDTFHFITSGWNSQIVSITHTPA